MGDEREKERINKANDWKKRKGRRGGAIKREKKTTRVTKKEKTIPLRGSSVVILRRVLPGALTLGCSAREGVSLFGVTSTPLVSSSASYDVIVEGAVTS